jgi:transcriptional regulator with XRE-family HTH domain
MSYKHNEITARLAVRLKEQRKSKRLSLDALSKLSGISRSMLSQIERGESSPTIASLWNLTQALNLDFTTLLDQEGDSLKPIREVLRADRTPVINDRTAGCMVKILSAPDDVGIHEVYDIRLEEGSILASRAHKKGCVEHLTVLSGQVEIISNGQVEIANKGDTIRYAADFSHSISAKMDTRFLLIVCGA